MSYPTNFNGHRELILEKATGADFLNLIAAKQQMVANQIAISTQEGRSGEASDANAQMMILNMLVIDLGFGLSNRLAEEAKGQRKAQRKAQRNQSTLTDAQNEESPAAV